MTGRSQHSRTGAFAQASLPGVPAEGALVSKELTRLLEFVRDNRRSVAAMESAVRDQKVAVSGDKLSIVELIGRGAQAAVFACESEIAEGDFVALKLTYPGLLKGPGATEDARLRFQAAEQEIAALQRLTDSVAQSSLEYRSAPNLLRHATMMSTGGELIAAIAMELVNGESFDKYILASHTKKNKPSIAEVIGLLRQTLQVVRAHELAGVCGAELHSCNFIVEETFRGVGAPERRVRQVDFGGAQVLDRPSSLTRKHSVRTLLDDIDDLRDAIFGLTKSRAEVSRMSEALECIANVRCGKLALGNAIDRLGR